jgi:hypothetical protein
LVSGAGTWTTELLGFTATRISDQQGSVVCRQNVLQFFAGSFINVWKYKHKLEEALMTRKRRLLLTFLIESHQRSGDRLTDSVNLSGMTTAGHTDANVNTGELFLQ